MIRLTASIVVALAVAASASQANADEITSISLPHIEPITLTYKAFDPQHVLIMEPAYLSLIAQTLSNSTRWPLRVGQKDTTDAVLDTGGRAQVDPQQHAIKIQYLAVTRYLSGGMTGTTLTIPVSYSVARSPDSVAITLTFPDQADSVRHGMPFLTRKLWATNEIVGDYAKLADSLKSVDLHLTYQASGEIEAKYKPDAVLGNLERLLGRPTYTNSPGAQISGSGAVTRDGVFIYTDQGERRQVRISTVPYHEGAKISYSASLPYTLHSDGSSSGDDSATALRDLLTKVVND